MTPMEEIAYHAIKNKDCHTVTDLMKLMTNSAPNNLHSLLTNLVRTNKIKKSNCPTCHKVGYYE